MGLGDHLQRVVIDRLEGKRGRVGSEPQPGGEPQPPTERGGVGGALQGWMPAR